MVGQQRHSDAVLTDLGLILAHQLRHRRLADEGSPQFTGVLGDIVRGWYATNDLGLMQQLGIIA